MTTGKAFEGIQCSAVRPQTEPDLMAWDPGSRANMKTLSDQGVVAVRYEANGCDVRLEVLSNCIGEGKYDYRPYSATATKMARTQQELYTELPLGAASLSGHLKGGKALRTDYILVGIRTLKAGAAYPRSLLRGDCGAATHIVSRMYVGGFAMVAGETQALSGGATIFGLSAGGSSGSVVETVQKEGNAQACERAQTEEKETSACGVPLRLGLLRLDQVQPVQPPPVPQPTSVPEPPPPPRPTLSEPSPRVPIASGCPSDMVAIPGGTFQMGSNDGDADEKPVHSVSVRPFCMDRTEVTVGAYRSCGSCSAPNTTQYCNWGQSGRDNHPINCVDWNQATSYCSGVGKRLPTEEEWEYAARGTSSRNYPWGNAAPASQLCWNGEGNDLGKGNRKSTCPVGSYAAGRSPFGLEDMAGNVWEWTSSPYCSYPGKSCTSSDRVNRGGSWHYDYPAWVRASHRYYNAPSYRYIYVGFRCLRAD